MILTLLAATMALCPAQGKRFECVHDADTVWIDGTKLRLENIDTAELNGKCRYERDLAVEARDRLVVLLNRGERKVIYSGRIDRYDRPLVRITVDGVDVGEVLVEEGLARRWTGRRMPWC